MECSSDEIWTTKDGRKIAVGDMTEEHVRNTLRMLLRKAKRAKQKQFLDRLDREMSEGDIQDMLSAESYNQLSNPNVFFPLLEGGKYGSPDLAARHDPRKF